MFRGLTGYRGDMKYKESYRRNLPHIQPEDTVFFITYRLYFEFPSKYKNKINTMKSEFQQRTNLLNAKQREIEKYKFEIILSEIEDDFIGKFRNSPLWLNENDIAGVVEDSLFWCAQKFFDLFAFCIMPNHVHIIIRPLLRDKNHIHYRKSCMITNILRLVKLTKSCS